MKQLRIKKESEYVVNRKRKIMMDIPTKEGKRRYPPDGVYKGDFSDEDESSFWEVCTCKSGCPDPCKGLCGCKACHASYMDFLSVE